jgi:hypothetical protein
MRIENLFCDGCGSSHFVEVIQRDRRGLVLQTKCHGKDFLPISTDPAISKESHIIRHRLRGYDVIKKTTPQPRRKLPTTFKRQALPVPVIPAAERACVAELSLAIRGEFVTIKVFADATPDKFYEFFYEINGQPKMVKPRNLGRDKAVHISDIARLYRIEGKVNLVFHNREAYEKLLTVNPGSISTILDKNMLISSGHG